MPTTQLYELHTGDCLEILRTLPDASVDSVVTDPPYGLSFMGKRWDYDVPSVEIWAECFRVLKPGGHLLAFAGTRTQHRMAVRIEDAGFEIRDMIAWVYGSGFPKSLNVAKAIESGGGRPEDIRRMSMGENYQPSGRGRVNYDHGSASAMNGASGAWEPSSEAARQWQGWGTALKPALEPITVARKPLIGTVAANVLAHGTGALNIDGCRVEPTGESRERSGEASQERRYTENGGTNFAAKPGIRGGDPAGRWPANLIHDGSEDVLSVFPDAKGQQGAVTGREPSPKTANTFGRYSARALSHPRTESETSAARFFYCAKASKKDRGEDNKHPTVKPTDLMRYLCRLVTPPGGVVLDPFMGSGSTGKAAVMEGFQFIGCELDQQHVEVATKRMSEVAPTLPVPVNDNCRPSDDDWDEWRAYVLS